MNQKTSICQHFKNLVSLTCVTRSEVAINMADPTCLLGDTNISTPNFKLLAESHAKNRVSCIPN